MSKKTLTLIIGLFVVTIVLVAVALNSSKTSPQPTQQQPIAIQPSPTPDMAHTMLSLAQGTGNTVNVMVDSGSNTLSGVQFELAYDPKVLTNVKITKGTFFSNAFDMINKVTPSDGHVEYALVIPPSGTAQKGTGTVATITYTPLVHTGSTSISFVPGKTLASQPGVTDSVLQSTNNMVTISLGTSVTNSYTAPSSSSSAGY